MITLAFLPDGFPREIRRDLWEALPPGVISMFQRIHKEFWHHETHKHLDEQTIRQYREYFQKHLR